MIEKVIAKIKNRMIRAMGVDTLFFLKAVHRETLELKEKYEVLSRDVAAIKVKLEAG